MGGRWSEERRRGDEKTGEEWNEGMWLAGRTKWNEEERSSVGEESDEENWSRVERSSPKGCL